MVSFPAFAPRFPRTPPLADLWRRGSQALLELIYPPLCTVCEAPIVDHRETWLLCQPCYQQVSRPIPNPCPCCAEPLPQGLAGRESCYFCRNRNYRFQGATAVGVYRGLLREIVLRMKRPQQSPLTLTMACLLARQIETNWPQQQWDVLVPLPMHWSRRLWRGVNSPEQLGLAVAKSLKIRYDGRILKNRRAARKQGTLTPEQRFDNVAQAFRISAGYAIRGRRVLLIDDILTTGATANEATRTLLRAGAASVHVAVVARGVGADRLAALDVRASRQEDGPAKRRP